MIYESKNIFSGSKLVQAFPEKWNSITKQKGKIVTHCLGHGHHRTKSARPDTNVKKCP